MTQLQNLYKEISPKYLKTFNKLEELSAKREELEVQYQKAEETLNTKEMSMIQAELNTITPLEEKLRVKRREVVKENSRELQNRILKAIDEDWNEVKNKDSLLDTAADHVNKAIETLEQLEAYNQEEKRKLSKDLSPFNNLLDNHERNVVSGVAGLRGYNFKILKDLQELSKRFYN